MKQVNYLSQRVGSWVLAKDAKGRVLTGYDGYNCISGSKKEMQAQIDQAKDFIFRNPKCPARPVGECPDWKIDKVGYNDWTKANNDARSWERFNQRAGCELYAAHPVFEDILVFDGYSKGQSSFTLDFIASNGQKISFGPKSTGELVAGIIAGVHVTIVNVVEHPAAGESRKNPDSPTNDWFRDPDGNATSFPTFFSGKAIELQFYFHKQGQNIYAQLYTGKE